MSEEVKYVYGSAVTALVYGDHYDDASFEKVLKEHLFMFKNYSAGAIWF